MISSKYAWPVIVLLLIALIPTVIHRYLGLEQDFGKPVANIDPILGEYHSMPSKHKAGWGEETFGCYDWVERIYSNGPGQAIRLFIGKSYDHKRLYHHPELALSHGKDLKHSELTQLDAPFPVNVNLLKSNNSIGVTAYALFYDGHFIDNPILHSLKNTLYMLTNPKKPLILFYVSDESQRNTLPFNETPAADLLKMSIADFLNNTE